MSELSVLARGVAEAGRYREAQVRYRRKLAREERARKRKERDLEFQREIEERRAYRNLQDPEKPLTFRAFMGLLQGGE